MLELDALGKGKPTDRMESSPDVEGIQITRQTVARTGVPGILRHSGRSRD